MVSPLKLIYSNSLILERQELKTGEMKGPSQDLPEQVGNWADRTQSPPLLPTAVTLVLWPKQVPPFPNDCLISGGHLVRPSKPDYSSELTPDYSDEHWQPRPSSRALDPPYAWTAVSDHACFPPTRLPRPISSTRKTLLFYKLLATVAPVWTTSKIFTSPLT